MNLSFSDPQTRPPFGQGAPVRLPVGHRPAGESSGRLDLGTGARRLRGQLREHHYGQQTKAGVPFGGAPFTFRRGVELSEITDGTTSTLLMSEVIVLMTTSTIWKDR